MTTKIKNILKYLVSPALLLSPWIAKAQGGISGGLNRLNQSNLPRSGLAGSNTVSELVIQVINILLFFSGMVAVVFIIIGGYYYITAQGNEEQAEKGKNTLVNAIIGLVLVILSWTIIWVVTGLVGYNQA